VPKRGGGAKPPFFDLDIENPIGGSILPVTFPVCQMASEVDDIVDLVRRRQRADASLHPPPLRKALAALLRLLADPAALPKPSLLKLAALAQPLVEWATSKSTGEVERVSCLYAALLCVFAHAAAALLSDAAVATVASLLTTVALSGAPVWTDAGWLADAAPTNDPVRRAAATVGGSSNLKDLVPSPVRNPPRADTCSSPNLYPRSRTSPARVSGEGPRVVGGGSGARASA
jgi:hypothetical protein